MTANDDEFKQALWKQMAKVGAERQREENRDFDAWDAAELEYLTSALNRLSQGESLEEVCASAAQELPALEESVAREESCPTFDWYDDHHYEKVYSGQLAACRFILRTCEELAQA